MPTFPRAQAMLKAMKIRTKNCKTQKGLLQQIDFPLDGLHLALNDHCGRIFQLLSSSATFLDCEPDKVTFHAL